MKKINLPNKRKPQTPEELDLARLRRQMIKAPVELIYNGYKVGMRGRRANDSRRISPYLQLGSFRIYACATNSYTSNNAPNYQLWYEDIFIECALNEHQLIARLNELYRLNKQKFVPGKAH